MARGNQESLTLERLEDRLNLSSVTGYAKFGDLQVWTQGAELYDSQGGDFEAGETLGDVRVTAGNGITLAGNVKMDGEIRAKVVNVFGNVESDGARINAGKELYYFGVSGNLNGAFEVDAGKAYCINVRGNVEGLWIAGDVGKFIAGGNAAVNIDGNVDLLYSGKSMEAYVDGKVTTAVAGENLSGCFKDANVIVAGKNIEELILGENSNVNVIVGGNIDNVKANNVGVVSARGNIEDFVADNVNVLVAGGNATAQINRNLGTGVANKLDLEVKGNITNVLVGRQSVEADIGNDAKVIVGGDVDVKVGRNLDVLVGNEVYADVGGDVNYVCARNLSGILGNKSAEIGVVNVYGKAKDLTVNGRKVNGVYINNADNVDVAGGKINQAILYGSAKDSNVIAGIDLGPDRQLEGNDNIWSEYSDADLGFFFGNNLSRVRVSAGARNDFGENEGTYGRGNIGYAVAVGKNKDFELVSDGRTIQGYLQGLGNVRLTENNAPEEYGDNNLVGVFAPASTGYNGNKGRREGSGGY